MQIHELNNFTGTLGSGAYLAIDDGTDTGKISSQGLLAATEARIDNIIAGPAPSAEEIVDARLGADGVTYPSLGDAIRDQFSDVKSALSETTANVIDVYLTGTTPYRGIDYTAIGHGQLVLNGTNISSATIALFARDLTLQAGTYTFGCYPPISGSGVKLQLRNWTGGSDHGNLVETDGSADFTLTAETTVRPRILVQASKTVNNLPINAMLTVKADWPDGYYIPPVTALDFVARGIAENIKNQFNAKTVSESFSGIAMASQGANTGSKLRVMSYNICNYNFDTSVYISDAKLFNLKKMFYRANADIVCCQEDRAYIDSGNTKASNEYVFYPILPFKMGEGGVTIHSKMDKDGANGIVRFSTTPNRALRYACYTIDGKALLIVSTHPGLTEANRAIEYSELFSWLNGDITLKNYSSDTNVSCPNYTHCIICGDMNSQSATDKTNLLTNAHAKNFICGNGDSIGWFITNCRNKESIDNIIVSENIIINSIDCYSDIYDDLYSDHVPLVADVTLL